MWKNLQCSRFKVLTIEEDKMRSLRGQCAASLQPDTDMREYYTWGLRGDFGVLCHQHSFVFQLCLHRHQFQSCSSPQVQRDVHWRHALGDCFWTCSCPLHEFSCSWPRSGHLLFFFPFMYVLSKVQVTLFDIMRVSDILIMHCCEYEWSVECVCILTFDINASPA